jgi:octaprenyl-diphosphate synthase
MEAKAILSTIRDGGKKVKVDRVVKFVESHGGLTYAENRAREFSAEAKRAIESFPDSEARQALTDLADFVVTREK